MDFTVSAAAYDRFMGRFSREPFTLGVGPAGDHVDGLDEEGRVRLRARCAELLPEPPFDLEAVAWAARGVRGGR